MHWVALYFSQILIFFLSLSFVDTNIIIMLYNVDENWPSLSAIREHYRGYHSHFESEHGKNTIIASIINVAFE